MSNLLTLPFKLHPQKFEDEVKLKSSVTSAIIGIASKTSSSTIHFKASITLAQETELFYLAEAHDPTPPSSERPLSFTMNEVPDYVQDQLDMSYRTNGFQLQVPEIAGVHDLVVTFPYPVALLGGRLEVLADMVGDSCRVELDFSPSTGGIVGHLTEQMASGAKQFTIDGDGSLYVYKGFKVTLLSPDMVTSTPLGEAVECVGQTITTSETPSQSMEIGSFVKVSYSVVPHLKLNSERVVDIGQNTHRATFLPAGAALILHYDNSATPLQAKDVQLELDYYI